MSNFFSAPKDPDTRRLWQKAINIKDYVVNNETFVCSKHFKKEDIITHWVSGVPPQVITIKYKKCRLRRGAIPIPINVKQTVDDDTSEEFKNDEIILDGKKYCKNIDLSNTEGFNDSSNCNLEDEIYEYIPEDSQGSAEFQDVPMEPMKKRKINDSNDCQNKLSSSTIDENKDIMYINYTNSNSIFTKENNESIQIHIGNGQNILTYFPRKSYLKNNEKVFKKPLSTLCTKYQQIIKSVNYWHVDQLNENLEISEFNQKLSKDNSLIQEIANNDSYSMLFEDFLEIYNELSLPKNWSASMICKGLATTILYSCMNISNTGMPYIEKKVFLNDEMILRCGLLNKEIKINSLLKDIKSFKVNSLIDIEDIIEKLDKIPLCIGVPNMNFEDEKNLITLADNVQRHQDCSLIIDKEESICYNCSSLLLMNGKNYHENDT
ncbi:uncharacterized protein LOC131672275 isoform X2 [Phymastichus coffea]|uniref:uncharacterized protein LOC131672275 isoform X2 n=1 Tax=Phymastichus coffea TaxID=108790 RepID=UPI00273A8ADE|nr:uncharacterized protein LOC131672275 isoform X2 [Phymastichus coffea]